MPGQDHAYLQADAEDRRAALAAATELIAADGGMPHGRRSEWLEIAAEAYRWLRGRESLRVVSIKLTPGEPRPEGTPDMATVFNLADTDSVPFSLTGQDAKGATVPLPDGFSAAWTLGDPDSTGAVLTPSADNTSAVLSAGVPDSNLLVSVAVTVTNADGSTSVLNGAEAVIVTATEATTVGIVAGTPTAEAPAAPEAPSAS
jgi:hypothetical protein